MGFIQSIKENKLLCFILVLFIVFVILVMVFAFNRDKSLEQECLNIGVEKGGLFDGGFFCIDEEGLYHKYDYDCNFLGTNCSITEYGGIIK